MLFVEFNSRKNAALKGLLVEQGIKNYLKLHGIAVTMTMVKAVKLIG